MLNPIVTQCPFSRALLYIINVYVAFHGILFHSNLLWRNLCVNVAAGHHTIPRKDKSVRFVTTSPFSDCIDIFGRIPGHVPNSKLVPGSVSLQTCKYACLQSPNCVAIDNALARNICYVITDLTMLRKRQHVAGFFIYPLLYRCPRPGKNSYVTHIHNISAGINTGGINKDSIKKSAKNSLENSSEFGYKCDCLCKEHSTQKK